ncbi:XkdW family protein [Robertmurraya korlensis]|uniref:XkdW family protein n=1 Tax=Robertmurraya korlensis TaxID=519977 RepID=UPI00203E3ADE|nr:XkdW family protein [Robertmurraya korlensis]MCM3599403.1 XkdW family protein [Robertmurraya korlensis]
MKPSILKRYPELSKDDVLLRDDNNGKGPYIAVWKSTKPKPTMDQVKQWVLEDEAIPKPLTPEEELEQVKKQQELMQTALDELIFSGGAF